MDSIGENVQEVHLIRRQRFGLLNKNRLTSIEKANFRPRIPNLKRWKASRTADIAVYSAATIPGLDPAQIGDPGSPTKVPRTYPPEVGAKGSMIDEGSTEKNVDRLFERIADVL